MKKTQLLKLIEGLKDNDEILLYNGFVDDYQDFDKELVEYDLCKRKVSAIQEHLIFDWKRAHNDFDLEPDEETLTKIERTAKQEYENSSYSMKSFVESNDEDYTFKKVFLIQTKSRGKEYWDRLGSIRY